MRADLVVAIEPNLYLFVGVRKRQEPVGVEALAPEAPVERFDERVVRRFPGREKSSVTPLA